MPEQDAEARVRITRRTIAKGLLAGAATAWTKPTHAAIAENESAIARQAAKAGRTPWKQALPGIWRARFGDPETFTPVRARMVGAREQALAAMPDVEEIPLAEIEARILSRGCVIELPLRPQEQIYGMGLQMKLKGETLEQRGHSLTDFAAHGGAFPIVVEGAGIVGSVTVSGLPQRQDHEFVVEALCTLLGKDYATLKLGPES